MRLRPTIYKSQRSGGGFTSRGPLKSAALDAESPFLVEFFMVQGMGFTCMAYRNKNGKWQGAFDDVELPGAVHILE